MTCKRFGTRCLRSVMGCAMVAAVGMAAPAFGGNLYFDVNDVGTGSGVSGGGVYSWSGTNWSTDASGLTAAGVFVNDGTGTAVFQAGTDGVGIGYVVNVDMAVSAAGLTFSNGAANVVSLVDASGSLTLTAPTVNVASAGGVAQVVEGIGGTVGLTKSGPGTLALLTGNTYTGGTTLSGGTLSFVNGALNTGGMITFGGNSTL